MKTQNSKTPCPQCGSYKIVSGRLMVFAIGAANSGCVGIIITFLIPPIGLFLIALGFIFMLISPFVNKKQSYCQECHLRFEK